jgi:hypothetical protein
MKAYGGSGGIAPVILNLNTTWGERLLHVSAVLPQEESPGTDYLGGWVGPRTGLDGLENSLLPLA